MQKKLNNHNFNLILVSALIFSSIISIKIAYSILFILIISFTYSFILKKIEWHNNILFFGFILFLSVIMITLLFQTHSISLYTASLWKLVQLLSLFFIPFLIYNLIETKRVERLIYLLIITISSVTIYFLLFQSYELQVSKLLLFFNNELQFGFCLTIVALVSLSVLSNQFALKLEKIMFSFTLFLSLIAIILLNNILIFFTLALSLHIFSLMKWRKIGIILILLSLILAISEYFFKFLPLDYVVFSSIFSNWKIAWLMIQENFFLGMSPQIYLNQKLHFSNSYLKIWLAHGLIGMISFIIVWLGLFTAIYFTLKRKLAIEIKTSLYLQAFTALCFSFLFLGFLSDIFENYSLLLILMSILGFVLHHISDIRNKKKDRL